MTKPVTPGEVVEVKQAHIPDVVIRVMNELIAEGWNGTSSRVYCREAAEAIARQGGFTVAEVYDRHMLDIEPIFRKALWRVELDRPGYNESYPAFWVFSRARLHS